eukprot:5433329-Prymnesium_polylepis.1
MPCASPNGSRPSSGSVLRKLSLPAGSTRPEQWVEGLRAESGSRKLSMRTPRELQTLQADAALPALPLEGLLQAGLQSPPT